MITKKLQTTTQKIFSLVLTLSLVFGANITLAQNQYAEPAGAPPGNNAPAPIHEGSTGQGKYWNNIPQYSLGSFLNIVEGLFSSWIVSDGAGVAATQFCLGTAEEIDGSGFAEDGSTSGLDCITEGSGWGSGEGGSGIPNTAVSFDSATNTLSITDTQGTLSTNIPLGSGGGGGGSSLQPGQINGNALVWRADTNSWVSSTKFRQVSFMGNGFSSFVMGNWPNAMFSTIFGTSDLDPADAFGKFGLNGAFYYRPNTLSDTTDPELEGGTPGKLLAGHATENYRVDWRTPGDLGLATQADLGNINTLIQNLATLPNGEQDGQLMWWNTDLGDGFWDLSNPIRLQLDTLSFVQGILKIGPNSDLVFANNDNCPNDSDGSVMWAKQRTSTFLGTLVGQFDIGCNGAIKIGQFFADSEDDTVVLTNVPQLEQEQITATGARNLCYTTLEVDGVEKGLVIDCVSRPTGSLLVNGPIPTNPNSNTASIPESTVELWEIPFGVDSVTVRACAGGGGAGGGAAGDPGAPDNPGGGGGGGGGAGQCVDQVIPLTEPNLTHLRITAGRGGAGGANGLATCPYGNIYGCVGVVATGGDGGDGVSGVNTKIEKMAGTTVISTPINLTAGAGGKGGKKQCNQSGPGYECGAFGGPGGRGGHIPLLSTNLDLATAQGFQNSNGQHGREKDINNAGTMTLNNFFFDEEYYASFCNNTTSINIIASCGGDGGDGQIASIGHPSSSNPYTGLWSALSLTSQGGEGGHGCILTPSGPCDNHFDEDWQGQEITSNAYHATWGSGGGGGPGANGWMWVDYNNGSGYEYRSYGGPGRRGGPGFAYLTW